MCILSRMIEMHTFVVLRKTAMPRNTVSRTESDGTAKDGQISTTLVLTIITGLDWATWRTSRFVFKSKAAPKTSLVAVIRQLQLRYINKGKYLFCQLAHYISGWRWPGHVIVVCDKPSTTCRSWTFLDVGHDVEVLDRNANHQPGRLSRQ